MAHVEVQSLVSDVAAVAQVEVYLDGHTFTASATGSAKKHPNDPAVHSVGEALSLARALRQVSEELEAYATDTSERNLAMSVEEKKLDRIMKKLFGDENLNA